MIPELRFAVVGARESGKTVFVQKALDLKRPIQSSTCGKKMSLEGQVFLINLVEVQLDQITVNEEEHIDWPSLDAKGRPLHIDGVLALYDVTKRESIARIPSVLTSKCDVPIVNRRIDPQEIEQLCMEETGIESIQISSDSPESYKRCVSVVLRNFITNHPASARLNALQGSTRPRAQTATHGNNPINRPQGKRSKHGRATSEISGRVSTSGGSPKPSATSIEKELFSLPDQSASPDETISSNQEASYSAGNRHQSSEDGVLSQGLAAPTHESSEVRPPDSINSESTFLVSMGTPTTIANSFVDFAAEPDSSSENNASDDVEGLSLTTNETNAGTYSGYTFEELIDRLLAPAMSKSDVHFSATFLCLYRKFASPAELLASIWQRFEYLQKTNMPPLRKISAQLRHLAVLAQWLSEYPGDFAHPFLRLRMSEFLKRAAGHRVFEAAASEMSSLLDTVVEDDDTRWACSDGTRGKRSTIASFAQVPVLYNAMNKLMMDDKLGNAEWEGVAQEQLEESTSRARGHAKSTSSASSFEQSNAGSLVSTPLTSIEAAQRRAELLSPNPRVALTKVQWRQFMELGDENIARELTRIDWILYSSIRPRDLVRHVSLSADQKSHCKGLEYVSRMINQFNHVAFWAASMILLREKAKHRAKVLEKFMGIAWKLRHLNNYNALGAIIAGINGIAVHRLTQTRELVPSQAQKDFMRLEILMSTHRSHFAYRLAWENTSTERIGFLPLHRRDLVSAEEGNPTLIGNSADRINWKKIQIMGDVIVSIRESQGTPYPHISRNPDVQRLVLEGRFLHDEDELYERSLNVEGPAANEPRRRFNWFQR